MMPITLVQTVSDAPTCRATSRLETSSRIMMQRLLKNARAYGNNRAARPTIPERLLTIASPGLAMIPSLPAGIDVKTERNSRYPTRTPPDNRLPATPRCEVTTDGDLEILKVG